MTHGWDGVQAKKIYKVVSHPPRPQLEKLVPYVPLPSMMVIAYATPYTKMEVYKSYDVRYLLT
jgi:hypothetical protein